MNRKQKYLEKNRELINSRARDKYQTNIKENRLISRVKMRLHRERRVRRLYPKWFKMSEAEMYNALGESELFYVGTPEPKQDKKILQKRAEFKSDMRFIQTIQGFRYRKERKTISIKEEKENCFIELLSEKELMKYIMRK
jgi:hypothetical protein